MFWYPLPIKLIQSKFERNMDLSPIKIQVLFFIWQVELGSKAPTDTWISCRYHNHAQIQCFIWLTLLGSLSLRRASVCSSAPCSMLHAPCSTCARVMICRMLVPIRACDTWFCLPFCSCFYIMVHPCCSACCCTRWADAIINRSNSQLWRQPILLLAGLPVVSTAVGLSPSPSQHVRTRTTLLCAVS